MDRRTSLGALLAFLLAAPVAVQAQGPRRAMPHIGILSPVRASAETEDLSRGLEQLGYVDRRSADIEWRSPEGKSERFAELAAELVGLKVDVIVALGSEATQAVKQATGTIPVVFAVGDPVGAGFVGTLAHPGGNLTGIAYQLPDIAGKYLQLLRDVSPQMTEVTILWSPNNPSETRFLHDAESAAPQFRINIHRVPLATVDDLDSALAAIERARTRSMIVLGANFFNLENDARVSEFAIKHRVATVCFAKRLVKQGLLMFYGPGPTGGGLQMANYVDKILKGAKPADLPVEQTTKFDLVINLKTAKALGLTIPQSLLLRADEVIQ